MTEPARDDLRGLGGWLILVGIGVVLSPIRGLIFVVQTYPQIFTDGHSEQLTTPGAFAYHPFWGRCSSARSWSILRSCWSGPG